MTSASYVSIWPAHPCSLAVHDNPHCSSHLWLVMFVGCDFTSFTHSQIINKDQVKDGLPAMGNSTANHFPDWKKVCLPWFCFKSFHQFFVIPDATDSFISSQPAYYVKWTFLRWFIHLSCIVSTFFCRIIGTETGYLAQFIHASQDSLFKLVPFVCLAYTLLIWFDLIPLLS